jgi:hypothetical protein
MSYKSNKEWRKKYPVKWNAAKKRYYNQFEANACNKYQIWTIGDIKKVENKDISDRNLSKQIGRTVKAIQMKRYYLKGEKLFNNLS